MPDETQLYGPDYEEQLFQKLAPQYEARIRAQYKNRGVQFGREGGDVAAALNELRREIALQVAQQNAVIKTKQIELQNALTLKKAEEEAATRSEGRAAERENVKRSYEQTQHDRELMYNRSKEEGAAKEAAITHLEKLYETGIELPEKARSILQSGGDPREALRITLSSAYPASMQGDGTQTVGIDRNGNMIPMAGGTESGSNASASNNQMVNPQIDFNKARNGLETPPVSPMRFRPFTPPGNMIEPSDKQLKSGLARSGMDVESAPVQTALKESQAASRGRGDVLSDYLKTGKAPDENTQTKLGLTGTFRDLGDDGNSGPVNADYANRFLRGGGHANEITDAEERERRKKSGLAYQDTSSNPIWRNYFPNSAGGDFRDTSASSVSNPGSGGNNGGSDPSNPETYTGAVLGDAGKKDKWTDTWNDVKDTVNEVVHDLNPGNWFAPKQPQAAPSASASSTQAVPVTEAGQVNQPANPAQGLDQFGNPLQPQNPKNTRKWRQFDNVYA